MADDVKISTWTEGNFPEVPQSLLWQLGQGLVIPAVMGSVLVFLVQNVAADVVPLFDEQPLHLSLKRTVAYLVAVGYVIYLCLSFIGLMKTRKYGAVIFGVDVAESIIGYFAIFAIGFITPNDPFGAASINIGVACIGVIALLRAIFGVGDWGKAIFFVRFFAVALAIAAVASYCWVCGGGRCDSAVPSKLYLIDLGLVAGFFVLIILYARDRFSVRKQDNSASAPPERNAQGT